MIELRLNVCVTSINVDKCEWTKRPIKPNDSSFGSRGKIQHVLYKRNFRSCWWLCRGWIWKNQVWKWKDQSKSYHSFSQERWWSLDLRQSGFNKSGESESRKICYWLDVVLQERIGFSWYRHPLRQNIVSILSLQVSTRKMVHLSSPLELGGSVGYLSRSAGHIAPP